MEFIIETLTNKLRVLEMDKADYANQRQHYSELMAAMDAQVAAIDEHTKEITDFINSQGVTTNGDATGSATTTDATASPATTTQPAATTDSTTTTANADGTTTSTGAEPSPN